MKKLAALSLAIALILSLAGCAAQAKTFDIGCDVTRSVSKM